MFGAWWSNVEKERVNLENRAQAMAIDRSHAVIALRVDGTIESANEHFIAAMGYSRQEIYGQHHRMFVEPAYARSAEYAEFWRRLARGEYVSGEFERIGKGGRSVWLHASYNPILDAAGKPYKIVSFALDVTEQTQKSARYESQLTAIGRSTGVMHFSLDGTITGANETILRSMGYALTEVQGLHHSMFVPPAVAKSAEYRGLWEKLRAGTSVTAQFQRVGKGGRVVWLEASYNPILDAHGKPYEIVKFALDVTAQKQQSAGYESELSAISRSTGVIHFDLDGNIADANENFLRSIGYTLAEVQGRHHSMLVEPSFAKSAEYLDFWAKLRAGAFAAGQYRRVGKGGRTVWLEASYNPIFDADGRPLRIVKFATDITALVERKALQERLVETTFDRIIRAVLSVGEQSQTAADASKDTASTVESVAASTEELDSSIVDIAHSMETSKGAVEQVIEETCTADKSSQRLSAKIGLMSDVVALIQEIAGQINLLSLNAAIEAARAGSAGRGFAVVAGEIKALADQVASASRKIEQDIGDVQATSAEVVHSLAGIQAAVESVKNAVVSTAIAVEEQSAVTGTISSSMKSASSSVASINESLGGILHLVQEANSSARDGKQTLNNAVAQ